MRIGLGSQSEVKQAAVHNALHQSGFDAEVVAVKALSGVSEQPFNDETIEGAQNRARHTAILVPDADITIAIESGIFLRREYWLDIAIVVVRFPDGEFFQAESEGVVFPTDAVEEVQRRGASAWTVGKILQEWNRVQLHNDPHLSLVGRSRADFINDTVLCLFKSLRDRHLF